MTYTQSEQLRTACAYLLTLVNIGVWLLVANRLAEIAR